MTADELEAALLVELARVRNALAMELTAELVERTPVDTGAARANWMPTLDAPTEAPIEATTSAPREAAIAALIVDTDPGKPAFVSNAVEYMPFLIAGWSSQAPAGWDVEAVDTAIATVRKLYDSTTIEVDGRGIKSQIAVRRKAEP